MFVCVCVCVCFFFLFFFFFFGGVVCGCVRARACVRASVCVCVCVCVSPKKANSKWGRNEKRMSLTVGFQFVTNGHRPPVCRRQCVFCVLHESTR